MGTLPERRPGLIPYSVLRTPRGSVVICEAHVVTDEVKDEEARALANALNAEYQKRNSAL